ncbi:MAG: tetratricopeptide repeat protein [Treponema sp.]|nr:tetratricopeptide repeat protein [Treponema sp.]
MKKTSFLFLAALFCISFIFFSCATNAPAKDTTAADVQDNAAAPQTPQQQETQSQQDFLGFPPLTPADSPEPASFPDLPVTNNIELPEPQARPDNFLQSDEGQASPVESSAIPQEETPVESLPPAGPVSPAVTETPVPEPAMPPQPQTTTPSTAVPQTQSQPIPLVPAPQPAPALAPSIPVLPAPQPIPQVVEPQQSQPAPQTSQPVPEQPSQPAPEQPETSQQAAPQPRNPPPAPDFLRPPEQNIQPEAIEPVPAPISPQVNPQPDLPGFSTPVPPEDGINFSRIVRATVGQLVEIPFRGTGWVFLGEVGSRRGISYDSRRLDPEGQSFIFRAEAAGTYSLKFYKQDFIRDYILNDYVQVIIGDAPDSAGIGWFNTPQDQSRVIAEPRWPLPESSSALQPSSAMQPSSASQPSSVQQTAPEDAAMQTEPPAAASADLPSFRQELSPASQQPLAVQPGPAAQPPTSQSGSVSAPATSAVLPQSATPPLDPAAGSPPDVYIRRAQEEYNAGRIETALSILDRFKNEYPSGADEAWWLYGQLLEANSSARDIKQALDYYRSLVKDFPQSSRVPEAQNRISYLERFYFNIR